MDKEKGLIFCGDTGEQDSCSIILKLSSGILSLSSSRLVTSLVIGEMLPRRLNWPRFLKYLMPAFRPLSSSDAFGLSINELLN